MMTYGLDPADLHKIKEVFAGNIHVKKVILFGSRAMGNFKPGSDVDLAVLGSELSFDELLNIQCRLDALGMLYTFDVQNLNAIKDAGVLLHIERHGKVLV
jgi:uncharacterized protein